ncbi:hypothetical protein C9980_10440 [Vibrio mediterranei]|uniref:DUF6515 family protein n=1 Tax=Vibrio mediterranei TaxID=689 RepID=UPI000D17FCE0|nr:DUF6515 family protein [Vibrio mediterranei]MCG9658367.1 hypothetical protein [Vibrio mediterranei]PTC04922.1 hypothetical protein C9980_10440 [Vibrio mediterranei]
MNKKFSQKTPLLILFLSVFSSPTFADPWHKHFDKPWKKHKHHKKEVHIVRHYEPHRMPDSAVMLAIAGVTYALIDGHYYKKEKHKYIIVEKPPKRRYRRGQMVKKLPEGATAVNKRGQQYFVSRGNWFLAVSNGKYVVVEP